MSDENETTEADEELLDEAEEIAADPADPNDQLVVVPATNPVVLPEHDVLAQPVVDPVPAVDPNDALVVVRSDADPAPAVDEDEEAEEDLSGTRHGFRPRAQIGNAPNRSQSAYPNKHGLDGDTPAAEAVASEPEPGAEPVAPSTQPVTGRTKNATRSAPAKVAAARAKAAAPKPSRTRKPKE